MNASQVPGAMTQLRSVFSQVKRESPILYSIVMLHLLVALICIPAMFIDDRMLLGISVWTKPFKFLISGAIYIFTVGYFISLYPYSNRKKSVLRNFVAWSFLIEIGIIVFQGARGVTSHFNQGSLLDGMLFATMGIIIAINVLLMFLFLVDAIRLKLNVDREMKWAIIMGWIILIIGSWIGGQMISELSHTVGAADGGPGLPLINWSTIAGDLRIAHFFGLHGLQIIPIFAYGVSKYWNTNVSNKLIAIVAFASLYTSWIAYTFYQAKQGIALLQV